MLILILSVHVDDIVVREGMKDDGYRLFDAFAQKFPMANQGELTFGIQVALLNVTGN